VIAASFDPGALAFEVGGIRLAVLAPLVDGRAPETGAPVVTREGEAWRIAWLLAGRERFELEVTQRDGEIGLACRLLGFEAARRLASLGLRFGRVGNVARYLRNGYMSWDGSYFVEPRAARAAAAADPAILSGYATTALVSPQGGAAVLGFLRHDRFQSRLRFDFADGPLAVDVETLIDEVPF